MLNFTQSLPSFYLHFLPHRLQYWMCRTPWTGWTFLTCLFFLCLLLSSNAQSHNHDHQTDHVVDAKTVSSKKLQKTTKTKVQAKVKEKAKIKAKAKTKPNTKKVVDHHKPKEEHGEFANFAQWKEVADFIDFMVTKHGYDKAELTSIMSKVRYVDTSVQLIKPAALGRLKNWQAYRARFVEPIRIDAGVNFWNTYADALSRAEAQYGVPAEIIVGIIGVETVYGRNTGNFRVLDAITTLAFDYPDTPTRLARMTFFKKELENTFLFIRDSGIDPFSLKGSYAGAIGWPQFMPGSIRRFAVDFDGDGKIDLQNSPVDAIGSVANFLVQHGWKRDESIVFPAITTNLTPENELKLLTMQGAKAVFTINELQENGIQLRDSQARSDFPTAMLLGLIDLQNGLDPNEYWLGTSNFFSITQYNRSYFYAMSVIDLGHAVRIASQR